MINFSNKKNIINFYKKLKKAQEAYSIIEGISSSVHLPFPDTIQKKIIVEFCDLSLELSNSKTIDLQHKTTKKLYELKSTTDIEGSTKIGENQAHNADYLIWAFIDFAENKMHLKILDLTPLLVRNAIIKYSKQKSFKIKKIFEANKIEYELVVDLLTLKCSKINNE